MALNAGAIYIRRFSRSETQMGTLRDGYTHTHLRMQGKHFMHKVESYFDLKLIARKRGLK